MGDLQRGNVGTQALQDGLHVGLAEVVPKAHELLAAIAGHDVQGSAGVAAHHVGHLFQGFVAFGMAIVVVVALEKIDIHHHNAQCVLLAQGLAPGAIGPGTEGAAVEQTGQEVLFGHVLQLLL